jgi:DNA uptake protein ComE-like DNA-binding protein
MMLYTRHQLLVVLLVVGAAGAGLAVDHWRRAYPDLAARLESADRAWTVPAAGSAAGGCTGQAGARGVSDPARCRGSFRAVSTDRVDVNRATEGELRGLPGIGPALASRIVAARPFADVEELRRVRGLRRTTLEQLRPLVTAGSPALHRE